MPSTQPPPPSPLRTGIIPSPGSSNASTPTPGPNQTAAPPGLASPSFLNQQPTSRTQSPFVPASQSSHRVSLSASSTSSNGSSSYLSASASANQPSSAYPSSASNASSADRSPPSPSFRTVQAAHQGLVGGGVAGPGVMLGPSPGVKVPGASAVRTPGGSFLSSAEESVWAPPGSATRVRTPLGGWGAVEELGPFGSGTGTPIQQLPPQPIINQQLQQQQTLQQPPSEDDELDKLLKKSPLVNSIIARIHQSESTVSALAAQLSTINLSLSSLVPGGFDRPGAVDGSVGQSEAVRALSSQVVALSSSVSQLQSLLATQQATARGQAPHQPQLPTPNLAPGGPGTPGAGAGYVPPSNPAFGTAPLGSTFNLTLPNLKGLPTPGQQGPLSPQPLRSPGAGAFGANGPFPTQADGPKRLNGTGPGSVVGGAGPGGASRPSLGSRAFTSPFNGGASSSDPLPSPGAGPNAPRRPTGNFNRLDSFDVSGDNNGGWPAPPAGPLTPGGSTQGPGTAHNMTKWDQVGLVPELLRGILKYGIGPPNKIQQRALPFLLKGSDIIAQAPPTQERIIAYVVPGINVCLSHPLPIPYQGPQVVIITTTVDQATQAYKVVRDLATPLSVRSSLCTGLVNAANPTWIEEQRMLAPTIVVGTPAKVNELFAEGRGLSGEQVRYLVIDEVDQLIARNLYEHVVEVVKRFPLPRNRAGGGAGTFMSPAVAASPYDNGAQSPFNPSSNNPFPTSGRGRFPQQQQQQQSNLAGTIGAPAAQAGEPSSGVERQTCLFSNTVPQDVLNFSNAINVREPVRVLVRRDGGGGAGGGGGGGGGGGAGQVSHTDPTTPGANAAGASAGLKHLYLYLAIASSGAARAADGPAGTIGSGRAAASGPESNQAKEWKLDALADLLDDEATLPALVFVGSESAMDAVVYKLSTKGVDAFFMHPGMNTQARLVAISKYRSPAYSGRGRALVVFDLHVKIADIGPQRLVINYDLPRSVEGYAQRVGSAVNANVQGRAGVVVNLIQANGGDVEMLRSIECAYKFKCSEVPVNLREAF